MQQVPAGGVPHHLLGTVRGLQRRLRWRGAATFALHGASLGALAGLLLVAVALWHERPPLTLPLLLGVLGLALVGIAVALARGPSLDQVARLADRHLQLDERLATALEILQGRLSSPLASRQLEDAWRTLHDRPRDRLAPLAPSGRLPAVAAVLLALFLSSLLFGTLVDPSNNPVAALRRGLEEQLVQGDLLARFVPSVLRPAGEADDPFAAAPPPPLITPQTEQQLREQLTRSRSQQLALSRLARALTGTAAAREIGEQLQRGDYAEAAANLRELGVENDQLSRQGKADLAAALDEAAAEMRELSPELAREAERAAQALSRGEYRAMQQALDQLGQAVDEASREVVPQRQLAQAWQRLQEERRGMVEDEFFDYDDEMGFHGAAMSEMQLSEGAGGHVGVFEGEDDGWDMGTGGEAGSSEGFYNPDVKPTRLNAVGREVELEGRPSGSGDGVRPAGQGGAAVSMQEGTETGALLEGEPQSTDPGQDTAERTSIPLGHLQTVHDYFHSGERAP